MTRRVIRRIRTAHCKRGPSICAACRDADQEVICLLDVCPPDAGRVQRRVIEVVVDGQAAWREYDVVRSFASEDEARRYAVEEGIADVGI